MLSVGAFLARPRSRARGEIRAVALIGAMTAGAALCRVSLCPFATLTGLPCPGCGILRATVALLRGHFAESLHLHPLALVVVPLVVIAACRARRAEPTTGRAEAVVGASMAVLVVAMLGVWVARFGGAFGGPAAVNSIWSATHSARPFDRGAGHRRDGTGLTRRDEHAATP